MSKHYSFTKCCYLWNSKKSNTNQNVIIQQHLITTICVNRFHQLRTGRLSKNRAHVLCNRSISLTHFDGQLMGPSLHKGSSTNSGHYISMATVGDIWFACDDVKITKIEFIYFCNSNTVYMLFYNRSTWWKHLSGIGLVPMDAACWVSWGEGIETPYSTGSSWRPPSMHCLLSFTFCYLFYSLAFVFCCF